ncbi:Protein ILM1 [Kluyveromyces marxianus]|uniref:Protein ILM1 n=2 Tax=Kluyveromyces marxianus TaxID=4911 RepID=W0TF77_KLUMD|nr:protein ILM1 [Kluyveromyces marxianus DMKU3-1042]KAG0677914.1 hypothetical protein C6P43_002269 [Kluyveromyces marxianus]KAG0683780.1 hypothetical protein C6P41_002853 [Kluyveromyces marxianus]QGN17121.1 protein ILM1 [Kluyveromyces marxianus]BAO41723.1 protein ILM1 [Kluyveromyces marxianus DMKU3-1042]BAP73168.1 protein ILM1 [Kluyveromyces marxianus]
MGLLSSVNVTYFRIVFLFGLAYLSVANVDAILSNNLLMVLTQAMDLPALQISPYSAQLGLISLLFALSAIHDLIPLLENNKKHFQSVVPFRLMIFFIMSSLSILLTNNLYLHNNVMFVYGFCEIWMNFLIFVALRDERNNDFAKENNFYRPIESDDEDPFPSTEREIQEMED